MSEENKITKRSDLFREYARVMDMCEGATIEPYSCVKRHTTELLQQPRFDLSCDDYEFALAIVEDRPVFKGDVLWTNDWHKCTVQNANDSLIKHDKGMTSCYFLTWQEPKRTITINGKEYTAPVSKNDISKGNYCFSLGNDKYVFDHAGDCKSVYKAIVNLLDGK